MNTALVQALIAAADALEANAEELTRLDSIQGDGDLGRTAGLIATALRNNANTAHESLEAGLRSIGVEIASSAPSSSGTLTASGFLAAAKRVGTDPESTLAQIVRAGMEGIQRRGKAEPGDRTVIDAIAPVVDSLETAPGDFEKAAIAAEYGVGKTRGMTAKFGRARFLAQNAVGEPDPGAAMYGSALAAALRN